jgi:2,3-dihydroxybenzoate decarboxylase
VKENVFVTNSGMAWAPAIMFCQQVLGMDRVLYAMDYPYQFEASEVIEMDAVGTDLDRKKFYESNARAVFKL